MTGDERQAIRLSPIVALAIIAGDGCENYTQGTCETAGRHPLARWGADAWCAPCLACAALASHYDGADQ